MKILTDKIDSLKEERNKSSNVEENEKITKEINDAINRKEIVENRQINLVGMQDNLSTLKQKSEEQLSDKDKQMAEMQEMIDKMKQDVKTQQNQSNIQSFNFGNMMGPGMMFYDEEESSDEDDDDDRKKKKKKKKKIVGQDSSDDDSSSDEDDDDDRKKKRKRKRKRRRK